MGAFLAWIVLLIPQTGMLLLVGSYVAHCFLVVLEDTAAGADKVVWPDEPHVYDWLAKAVYLVVLLGIWVAGAGVLLTLLKPGLEAVEWWLILFMLTLLIVWLVFPVSLLSSLSGTSRMEIIRPVLVARLAQHPLALLAYFAASGLVLLFSFSLAFLGAYGWDWTLGELFGPRTVPGVVQLFGWVPLMPMIGMALAAGILIYARLLGRLAWVMNYRLRKRKRKKTPKLEATEGPASLPPPAVTTAPAVPLAGPPPAPPMDHYELLSEEPSPATPAEVYEILPEEPASAPLGPPWWEGMEPTEGEMQSIAVAPMSPGSKPQAVPMPHVSPPPMPVETLLRPEPKPARPRWPFISGVYLFPWYPTTLMAWAIMSLGITIILVLFRIVFLASS
jgi:hypothetical protein